MTLPVPGSFENSLFFSNAGIFKDGPFDEFYDISAIPDLTAATATASDFRLGAGTPIRDLIDMLESQAAADPVAYGYATQMAAHLKKVNLTDSD